MNDNEDYYEYHNDVVVGDNNDNNYDDLQHHEIKS